MVSAKKFKWKRIPLIIITVLFAFCALSMAATKVIYDRVFVRYDIQAPIPEALSEMVQGRTVCRFPSGENQLTGYYYGPLEPEKAHGLIVFVPGFCAGGDDYLWQIHALREYGWGVFTFDTTGTCQSQGESQVGFSQSIPDLDAALNYLEKQGRMGYNDLVLMGHSRGAYAVCCALAQNRDVAAVVSISGVNSAMDAVMAMSVKTAGPISYGNYGFLWLYQAMLFGKETLDMQASEILSAQNVPALVIHGQKDDQVASDTGAIVAHQEQIASESVEYLLVDAGHTDLLYDTDGTANDALMDAIHTFLMRTTGK